MESKDKKRRYPSLDVPLLVYSIANGIDDELPDFISCEKLVFGFFLKFEPRSVFFHFCSPERCLVG